jgi:rhamnosyltransferase subunit B
VDRDIVARVVERGDPLIVVTLGSFIGRIQAGFWKCLGDALAAAGLPALLLGIPQEQRSQLERPGITCAGFVPMSSVIGHARLLVHHGGIGTSYAALQAGVPAAVVPQAFDQPFNGRLLEAAGVGRLVRPDDDLGELLPELLAHAALHDRARALADTMVQPAEACIRIANRIVDLVPG